MRHIESRNAVSLFRWARFQYDNLPGLDTLFHVPNGGARNKREAGRMKSEGVRPGVNDYILPVARCGFHGVTFELKSPGQYPNKNQRWFMAAFHREGWLTFVAWDWLSAAGLISDYLNGKIDPDDYRPGVRIGEIRVYGDPSDLFSPPP